MRIIAIINYFVLVLYCNCQDSSQLRIFDSLYEPPVYLQKHYPMITTNGYSKLKSHYLFVDFMALSRNMVYFGCERRVFNKLYISPFLGFSYKTDLLSLDINSGNAFFNKDKSDLNYSINSDNFAINRNWNNILKDNSGVFNPYKSFGWVYGLETRFYFKASAFYALAFNLGYRYHDSFIYIDQDVRLQNKSDNSVFFIKNSQGFKIIQEQIYSGMNFKVMLNSHISLDFAANFGAKQLVYNLRMKSLADVVDVSKHTIKTNGKDLTNVFVPDAYGQYPQQKTLLFMFNFRLAYSF